MVQDTGDMEHIADIGGEPMIANSIGEPVAWRKRAPTAGHCNRAGRDLLGIRCSLGDCGRKYHVALLEVVDSRQMDNASSTKASIIVQVYRPAFGDADSSPWACNHHCSQYVPCAGE